MSPEGSPAFGSSLPAPLPGALRSLSPSLRDERDLESPLPELSPLAALSASPSAPACAEALQPPEAIANENAMDALRQERIMLEPPFIEVTEVSGHARGPISSASSRAEKATIFQRSSGADRP